MNWKHPNTITGPVAEGTKYFNRTTVENKIWQQIEKESHVLFLAPRRVGKSSIVKFMSNNNRASIMSQYENIQSDRSLQDFYKRMYKMTIKTLSTGQKAKEYVLDWINKRKITSISANGIVLGSKELDYRSEFFELVKDLQSKSYKIVLFLDEFPDVIKHIYEDHGKKDAEIILDDLRTLRSDENFTKIFSLVLLGSVGLNHIVKQISGRIDKVNDLHKVYLHPLKEEEEGLEFIEHLVGNASMQLTPEIKSYLISKIGYIPFYLQLLIEACDDILFEEQRLALSIEDIDNAYQSLLKKNEHFNDWEDRLQQYFQHKFPFLSSILVHVAHNNSITIQEVYNKAVEYDSALSYKADLDDILIADGYIYENDNSYYFNSPLLKDWWKSRHPIF